MRSAGSRYSRITSNAAAGSVACSSSVKSPCTPLRPRVSAWIGSRHPRHVAGHVHHRHEQGGHAHVLERGDGRVVVGDRRVAAVVHRSRFAGGACGSDCVTRYLRSTSPSPSLDRRPLYACFQPNTPVRSVLVWSTRDGRPADTSFAHRTLSESPLTDPAVAPKQGDEGAPDARIVIDAEYRAAVDGLRARNRRRSSHVARQGRSQHARGVHPRDDPGESRCVALSRRARLDRPNPIGLHQARIVAIDETGLTLQGIEAVDGTPVIDIKPVLGPQKSG